jgi:hypothetical protein
VRTASSGEAKWSGGETSSPGPWFPAEFPPAATTASSTIPAYTAQEKSRRNLESPSARKRCEAPFSTTAAVSLPSSAAPVAALF